MQFEKTWDVMPKGQERVDKSSERSKENVQTFQKKRGRNQMKLVGFGF